MKRWGGQQPRGVNKLAPLSMGLGWVRVHGLDSYQIVPGILSL